MKLSFYGKAMHFYMWFGRFFAGLINIFILTLLATTILITTVPQFSSHKPGFKRSSYVPMAIAQTTVSITFLVSLVGGVGLAALVTPVALLEIPIELLLRKRVYKLVKERVKMSLDELVKETGVQEQDLSFLLKNWIVRSGGDIRKVYKGPGIIKRGHLRLDLNARELLWEE